jgi:hypothetical protein
MGKPVEAEHPSDATDMVQLTTTGLAVWREGDQPSFTDGWRTWKLEFPEEILTVAATVVPQQTTGPPSSVWDRLAACESSGRWATNSGNGYYGGLQEDLTFWRRYGGTTFAARPDQASRLQQITVAIHGQQSQGWQAWPRCSRIIGLR